MATLTLRIPKGSPLTNAELDANFAELNNEKIQLGGDIGGTTSSPVVISLRGRSVSTAAPTTGQTLVWTGTAWTPQTLANTSGTTNIVVLNDISNQFNRVRKVFTLKSGATAITEGVNYRDNRDFTVIIGGRYFYAQVPQISTLGPWIVDYVAGRTYEFKVTGSKLIFYREIFDRQGAEIRINNVSASRQKRSRYPFSANSIVLGE